MRDSMGARRGGLFLSYARKDGEPVAEELRRKLLASAPDIRIKQDRLFLEGGRGFWQQLADAIDSVEFLVLVMTPAALESEWVRKEWEYARRQGVCVYPVKAAGDATPPPAELPHWMRRAHWFDIGKEWESFVAHVRKGCDTPRVPFMAPDLPAHFVERPGEFSRLKQLLLTPGGKDPVAITTAISGGGGFGKTTLAAAICHDEDIRRNFDDGILWVTLGQEPAIVGGLVTLYAALTGERPGFASLEDAIFQLGQKLEGRNCLLVIDDVWEAAALRPFLHGGRAHARLFTTRDAGIAASLTSSAAQRTNVDRMREGEALALLGTGMARLRAADATELSHRLGAWPLALELARAMMLQRIANGAPADLAARRMLEILDQKGVRALRDDYAQTGHQTITSVLEASVERLSTEDRRRFAELSIFPEDVAIPLSAAEAVWGTDELATEGTAQRLAHLSLARLDLDHQTLRLHDVIRRWLALSEPEPALLHSRLVDSWPDWRNLPYAYAWLWLPWHLAQAGRKKDLERILWDPLWLQAKIAAAGVNALMAGLDYLKPAPEAELLRGALSLSSHVLASDSQQFASQISSRLLPHTGLPAVKTFLDSLTRAAPRPWLRPLWPSLHPPGTGLERTLTGHSEQVVGVAIGPTGRRAVSASLDHTLVVWDLDTGAALHTLRGHSHFVNDVAVTPDGRLAVSASWDKTLKIWDLESGAPLRTLAGHTGEVWGVAVSPNGQRAVSASTDRTLKVWDLATGACLRTLNGHTDSVTDVAISGNGRSIVSSSQDQTIRVWDMESGTVLRTLAGHTSAVFDVAVDRDGGRAVSASDDQTLKVWDLQTGVEIRTLSGHTGYVRGVALNPEGRQAVSGSFDRTVRVWDLEAGIVLQTLTGHAGYVEGVAVSPDGRRVLSVSYDKTVKIWDLEAGNRFQALAAHSDAIHGIAVSPDGRNAVTASYDRTLKVWDLAQAAELHTLAGHAEAVNGVAVSPDGRWAVSASDDKTLKVWDLQTGAEVRTLAGHWGAVTNAAVSGDGQWLVSASRDGILKVWDMENGALLRTLDRHSSAVFAVAVCAGRTQAVSASQDTSLKVWDLETGAELRTLRGHSSSVFAVAVGPSGQRAVSGSHDRTLRIWDLHSETAERVLTGHSDSVCGVAVSPDERLAVSASWDHTLKVWDLETGANLATYTCDALAWCCAFAGIRTIVAGDQAGRLHYLAVEL